MRNTELLIMIVVTLIMSILSMLMLRREWSKEDKKMFPFPKKLAVYALVMIVMQLTTLLLAKRYYPGLTICICIKRMGLLALIWQAAAHDYREHKIPNKIILTGIIFRVLMLIPEFILERDVLLSTLFTEGIALIGVVIFIGVCLLLMKNSIGMGDFKLLMLMAITQGVSGVVASVFCSLIFTFIVAVVLLTTGKKSRKDTLPFAPFVTAGTILAFVMTGA